ncbi:MAG TPA: acetate--CoA ligase family protein [Nevskiaceae bacterium]|nr:acetate--CoA ligase family protein [Nevskiaceae bacterium]
MSRTSEARSLPALPQQSARPITDDSYWASRELLATSGLGFPHAELVHSAVQAVAAGGRAGFPVVLKAMGLLHKSDAGGVALGLKDAAALTKAFGDMDGRLHAPAYTVEAMADLRNAVELIAGVQLDPRFGPVVMVGLGGVLTEVLRDVAFALAPVDAATARRMLESLRTAAVLHGVRGKPAVDVAAAAEAIARISKVAVEHPEIRELEVNPLLVTPTAAMALDARIVLAQTATRA